jgi:HAD superfamily hydrolase (TIGR01458 family)
MPTRGVLIDIDGVLTVSWEPLPGAVEALRTIRDAGLPVALLTNTTSRTRASIAGTLSGAGFPVETDDVLTAPALTAAYLREQRPDTRCALLNDGDIAEDLTGVRIVDPDSSDVDVVLLGGAGPPFDYAALNKLFALVQAGAVLVAMHRNLFWRTSAGLQLDTGAFLIGLERAAGVEATVLGKPSGTFFATALASMEVPAAEALMVGDDLEADVLGAQEAGISGVLVRTGKYQPGSEDSGEHRPDHVLDSFADLPAMLRL